MHLRSRIAQCLVPVALGACLTPLPEDEPTAERDAALDTTHEPRATLFWRNSHTQPSPYFAIDGVDRPTRVSVDWFTNGTPYNSLFVLAARSPAGVDTVGDLSSYPSLEITDPVPGETSYVGEIYQISLAPEFQVNLLIEQAVHADELGACGDQVRDQFLRWVGSWFPWRHNPNYKYFEEIAHDHVRLMWSHGVGGFVHDLTLRGVYPGTRGSILQVEDMSEGRLRLNTLLFHDEQGKLFKKLDGLIYDTLPDGNLLVSPAMQNDGGDPKWSYVVESVQSVTRSGNIAWSKPIGGTPSAQVAVTAAGNYIMPWHDVLGRAAGIRAFDPHTGADVSESFVDRSELCTPASTAPSCVELRDNMLAWFQWWWDSRWWTLIGSPYWLVGPHEICDASQQTCAKAELTGWLRLGDEAVFEIAITNRDATGKAYRNVLMYTGDPQYRELPGKVLRKHGADQILISETMGNSGQVPTGTAAWYGRNESLAMIKSDWTVAWRRGLNGPPVLLGYGSNGLGSRGFVLPGDQLYWAGWESPNGNFATYNTRLDLATGAVLALPPPRTLVGACKP